MSVRVYIAASYTTRSCHTLAAGSIVSGSNDATFVKKGSLLEEDSELFAL